MFGMSRRRILTILVKDLKDAIRDARVLFALLLPLGIGVFYNLTFSDESLSTLSIDVVYVSPDASRLPALVTRSLAGIAEVTLEPLGSAADVEGRVRDDAVDLGIVLPAGFDAAIMAGQTPGVQVFTPPGGGVEGDYVLAALPGVLRRMAGPPEPATVTVTPTSGGEDDSVLDRVGAREWAVMSSLLMMIGMIAMLAVPIVLAEETEKKTLDALTLVSSYAEVVVGKALLGVVYALVMVPMLLVITGQRIVEWPLFVAATTLVTATLLGFGLLMAGLFKSANQLNTWGGLLLLPVIGPAFAVALPLPGAVRAVVQRIPTGEAAKLLLNAATGDDLFRDQGLSLAVIALWGVAAYGLLLWRLSRREG